LGDARIKGTIKKWFDDKGYGFLSSEREKNDLFIHISAFDKNISRRPQAGDTVFFFIKTDKDGKSKAVDAVLEGVGTIKSTVRPVRRQRYSNGSSMKGFGRLALIIVLFVGAGAVAYSKYFSGSYNLGLVLNLSGETNTASTEFTCQGKTHCSQMTSCEEANFYIRNCPNTQMDGDGDGIPCERQWCY